MFIYREMTSHLPKNIFLKNVFADNTPTQKEPEIEQKNNLPGVFTDLNAWEKTTIIPCFNCHRTFNTIPWIAPTVLERVNNKNTFKGYGCFCSEHCAQSHIETKNYAERASGTSMLLVMCRQILGQPRKFITPSEPFTSLKKYGGDKTEEEYDAYITALRISDQKFS
jgi:ribosomal protein L34E